MSLNETPNIQSFNDTDEISLKELIIKIKEWVTYLKSQWKIIFAIAAVGGIIGFVYASFQKPTFKAVMTFVLDEDKGGGMSGAMGLASTFGIDLGSGGGGLFTSSNIIELMKSRFVIEKALLSPIIVNGNQISLADYYALVNKLNKDWDKKDRTKGLHFPFDSDRSRFSLVQDSVLQQIGDEIVKEKLNIIQKDKKVSIITIEVKTIDEQFSKLFCEQLAKETSEFYIETKSKKSRINVDILQKQSDSIRAELNGAIVGVASANDNVYNLNPALNVKRTPGTRRQVDVQANTAILTQLVAQLELAKVNLRKETPLIQVVDQPIYPLEKEKVGKLKSLILGVFLGVFVGILYLILISFYKKILDSN